MMKIMAYTFKQADLKMSRRFEKLLNRISQYCYRNWLRTIILYNIWNIQRKNNIFLKNKNLRRIRNLRCTSHKIYLL